MCVSYRYSRIHAELRLALKLLSRIKQSPDISLESVSQVRKVTAPLEEHREVFNCHTKSSQHHCYASDTIKMLRTLVLSYVHHTQSHLELPILVRGKFHSAGEKEQKIRAHKTFTQSVHAWSGWEKRKSFSHVPINFRLSLWHPPRLSRWKAIRERVNFIF